MFAFWLGIHPLLTFSPDFQWTKQLTVFTFRQDGGPATPGCHGRGAVVDRGRAARGCDGGCDRGARGDYRGQDESLAASGDCGQRGFILHVDGWMMGMSFSKSRERHPKAIMKNA